MLANTTSRRDTKLGSSKDPCLTFSATPCVTSRYIRLKQATPSSAGRAELIDVIRAMTSSMVAAGAPAGGAAGDWAVVGGTSELITSAHMTGPPRYARRG